MNDFNRTTLRKLAKKGITLVGITLLPGAGDLAYVNGERGYCLNDNGTHRVLTFLQVMDLAA